MKKYQDILRAQTSKNFASKRVTTSMLMLPLRLESKIMTRDVDMTDEPERAILAFRALDELVLDYYRLLNYRSKPRIETATRSLILKMQEVIHAFQQIDLLYAEDKSYLTDLTKNIYNSFHTRDLKNAFAPVLDTLKDITPLTTYSDNPATNFINQLERITRMLESTLKNPRFCGNKRLNHHDHYSQTARYRLACKRFKEINSWFIGSTGFRHIELLANAIPARMITNAQVDKYSRLMHRIRKAMLTDNSSQISNYQSFLRRFENIYNAQRPDPGVDGHSREKNKVYHYNQMLETASHLYNNVFNFIINGGSGNVYSVLAGKSTRKPLIRYTLLVSKLITAELKMVKAKTAINWEMRRNMTKEAYRSLSTLENLISKTYFIDNEQRNFVRNLLNFMNSTRINNPADKVSNYSKMLSNCLVINPVAAPAKNRVKCLCLRIYPDIVALAQIVNQISREEYSAGKDFWLKYIFNEDEKYRHSLWLALCDIYPAHRAAFIIKCTYPKANYANMCKKAQEFHNKKRSLDDFIKEIDDNFVNAFPMTSVDNGEQLFTVPVTNLLPDRFVVHATVKTRINASRTIIQYGHRLPKQLQVGLDLNNLEAATKQNNGQLYLNGGLSWMTDYDEAERMGMAISIPLACMKTGLNNTIREFEFKQIFVYGISDASDMESGKMLEDMLTAHLYSDKAMDVISFETASNIITSEDAKYAFDSSESKQRERFKHQPFNCINPHTPVKDSDLGILDRLFGLSKSVLGDLDEPNKPGSSEVELQRYVNKMMIDYLTDSALDSKVNPLLKTFRNTPGLYDYLCNDVLPRGPFPMIRIGDQPYGILPACDLRNLAIMSSSPLAIVKGILLALTNYWNAILDKNIVTCYGKDSDNSGATITTRDYLQILGNTPRSTSFYKRMMVKGGLMNPENLRGELVSHQIQDITAIANGIGLSVDRTDVKSIIPDYDYVPVYDKNETTHDNACFVPHDALDIDNIVKHIISGIRQYNNASTGLKLSDSTDLIRNYVIEFFDLFNYRLDAWLMGLLNNKIRMRINQGKHNLALGCFGWLFNLKEVDDFKHGCTNEYIIAPSVNQAITGAILRSSYNNSVKNGKAHNYDMGVNLSSERVRTAIRIIEGIQNGLSLGCILGADMERLIHEAYKTTSSKIPAGQLELDSCIYKLRQRYPLVKNDQESGAGYAPLSITVLNGARLLDEYATYKDRGNDAVKSWLKNTLKLFDGNNQQDAKIKALMDIIDIIDDEKDALTDVVLSESVYKLTQGNTEASAAISRALEELKNIPMPEVAEIPITSAQIDGYMLAMLPADAVCNDPNNLLASIEPKVEAWLQLMMHKTDKIYMSVKCPVSGSGKIKGPVPSLGSLGISASEMVYLSADKASFTHFVEVLSWMKTGVFREYDCESPVSSNDPNLHAFSDCSMAIDELRNVLAAAHPLTNDDLVKRTGMPSAAVYNAMSNEYHNVESYISRLIVNIQQLIKRQSAIQNPANADYELAALPDEFMTEAVRVLLDCYRIGNTMALDAVHHNIFIGNRNAIDGVVDWKNTVQSQHALFQSMQMLYENLQTKLAQAEKIVAGDPEHKYTTYVEAINTLLVSGYLIIPSFRPDDNVPIADLAEQAKGKRFLNISNMEIEAMIGDLARVEQPMMNLHQVRLYQKCDDIDTARIVPMQLASVEDNTNFRQWLGTAVEHEDYVTDAFTYMVMNPEHIINAAHQEEPLLAGIVIDHWVERIPYREQTAAVAFGYDQPDAEAPQTLLLAIATKDNKKHWSEKMLANSLKSAIHMAKCRTVSPDMLCNDGWTGGLLPLLEYMDPKSRR